MRLLDLFSGTGSVSKAARALGFEVVSLDLDFQDATIVCDVLDWDYRGTYPPRYVDVIWASCPCNTFSIVRNSLIGRFGYTRESLQSDMLTQGVPLLRKTEEIIEYFQPTYWFIENPKTSKIKHYINETTPYYDVDYCKYGFPYAYGQTCKALHPRRAAKTASSTQMDGTQSSVSGVTRHTKGKAAAVHVLTAIRFHRNCYTRCYCKQTTHCKQESFRSNAHGVSQNPLSCVS